MFIGRWITNYPQEQISILRGVIYEEDEILGELPRYEGIRILVLLPHGKLIYVNIPPINYFFNSIIIGLMV